MPTSVLNRTAAPKITTTLTMTTAPYTTATATRMSAPTETDHGPGLKKMTQRVIDISTAGCTMDVCTLDWSVIFIAL